MNKIDHSDCFARSEMPSGKVKCSALINFNCKNCKFYRTDIKRQDIERDIKYHNKTGSVRNEHRL